MITRPIVRTWPSFLFVLLPAFALAQDPGFVPPIAVFFHDDFESATTIPEDWQIDAGSWAAANGTYNSQGAPPTARTTITRYENPRRPGESPATILPPYDLRARVRLPAGGAQQLVGVVFDYEDAANFVEAVFSPAGTYALRKMRRSSHSGSATRC